MFTKHFDKFVCEGDSIKCKVDGFICTATLYRDDDYTPPDKRQDGFWPSLDPKSDGYIGPKSKRTLAREMAKAKNVMRAWENDEWHYFGVSVTVTKAGVPLVGKYQCALWGIEGNYPSKEANPNTYFREVANDLLCEAIPAAKEKLAKLCAAEKVA